MKRHLPCLSLGAATVRPAVLSGVLMFGFATVAAAQFDNTANQNSPVATNLSTVEDFVTEYPFVNFIKQARPWFSGPTFGFQDNRELNLDANGNVLSLEADQAARTILFDNFDSSLIGRRFLVLFEGEGDVGYQLGAQQLGFDPNRHLIEIIGNGPGEPIRAGVTIFETNPANPVRNFRIVPEGGICEDNPLQTVADAGACPPGDFLSFETSADEIVFNPDFLDRIKTYRGVRFMDWMRTNSSTQGSFAQRPLVSHQFWSTERGVPLEVMIDLVNLMNFEAWFNIPHLADDAYVTQFATIMRDQTETARKIYVEYSNEVWNGIFVQTGFCADQGEAAGLDQPENDRTIGMLRFYSRRSRQVHAIFVSVFGGTARLERVMATQAVIPFFTNTILEFENASATTDVFAIAPYLADTASSQDQADAYLALGVDGIFDWLNGLIVEPRLELNLPRVNDVVADQVAAAAGFGIPLITYEGGQHFVGAFGFEFDDNLNTLFNAVNRDPRIHDIYITYLQNWAARSDEAFWHFTSVFPFGPAGRWGALEFQTQTRANAPKFDAIQDIIEAATGVEGDSDGDGMTDVFENANGLDPDNPDDASADADNDGLTNLEEFNAGTDPNDADSDDDGIRDGLDGMPLTASNVCTGADAVFESTNVTDGTTVQCAASASISVQSTVTIETGGRVEMIAPQTSFSPGFSLPVGAELGVFTGSVP